MSISHILGRMSLGLSLQHKINTFPRFRDDLLLRDTYNRVRYRDRINIHQEYPVLGVVHSLPEVRIFSLSINQRCVS